jgi:NTP pyrophosphatase (non-canonical NTP hydrolase)
MTGREYQKLAMRTNDGNATDRLCKVISEHTYSDFEKRKVIDSKNDVSIGGIFNACLGLSGEVGEFNDMVKKWVFHEKELDIDHAKKEAGDICWYLAMLCESFGWNLEEIMQMNVDKLKARYPEGFDIDRANHREEGDV